MPTLCAGGRASFSGLGPSHIGINRYLCIWNHLCSAASRKFSTNSELAIVEEASRRPCLVLFGAKYQPHRFIHSYDVGPIHMKWEMHMVRLHLCRLNT